MRGAALFIQAATLMALVGCARTGELAIRATPTGLAAGERPVSFRVAEARGQFALGNVALALEGFRKALREDTGNVDAMNGIAACYDRMGRFDLSRRYYESALAMAPGDPRLYANLALSLELQGRADEAAGVRAESARRMAAGQAAALKALQAERIAAGPSHAPADKQSATANAGWNSSVTIPLPAPVPTAHASGSSDRASTEPAASVSVALPAATRVPERSEHPRLERLSPGEVALVTGGPIRWKSRSSERQRGNALAANSALLSEGGGPVTLLNAARHRGLAARTRAMLQGSGLGRIAIGNAPQVQRSSVIAYPLHRRTEAVKIASRLGFALEHQPRAGNRLVIYLGRDAASAEIEPR